MADIEQRIRLVLEGRDLQQAERLLADLTREQNKLRKEFKSGERDVDSFLSSMRDLQKEERKTEAVINDVTAALDKQGAATRRANDDFSKVSSDVALSGDIESGLRTIGGAAGFFGAPGAEKALAGGGEVFAVVEALPKLKTALAGLPSVLKNAASALGPTGIFVGIVLAGLAVLVAAARRANADMKAAVDARLNVEEEVAARVARGDSTEAVRAEIAELERLLPEQQRLEEEARVQRRAAFEERTEEALGSEFLGRVREATGITESTEIQAALDRRIGATAQTEERIRLLTEALERGDFAAEEATSAEEELQKQREASTQVIQEATRAEQERARFQRGDLGAGASSQLLSAGGLVSMLTGGASDKEGQKRLEDQKELDKQLADLRQDTAERRIEEQLDYRRNVIDIDRDYDRRQEDALAKGRFLELRNANRDERRAEEDAKINSRRANEDINREATRARDEYENQFRELSAITETGMNRVNALFSQGLQRMEAATARFAQGSGSALGGLFGLAPRGQ